VRLQNFIVIHNFLFFLLSFHHQQQQILQNTLHILRAAHTNAHSCRRLG